jgi:hypothetical protein
MREGIELYGATRFSAFDIFDPNENTLSRVIVELFDPLGSHGQGLLFLNALLVELELPRVRQNEPVRVRREAMTRARRRIDIVIETSQYVIGIENKPWAIQQVNQLADYLEELKADLRGRKPVLIFLSDQDERSAHGEVVGIPYAASHEELSLRSLLAKVKDDIKALKPRAFVLDFIRYIDSEFGSDHVDDEADKPFLDAVGAEFDDPLKRKAVATVLLAQYTLHTRILSEVGDFVLSEVRGKLGSDYEPVSEFKLGDSLCDRYYPWGVRRATWPSNCIVGIEAQADGFDRLIFGVRAPDASRIGESDQEEASPARPKLEMMTRQIPGGRKTPWWPWMQEASVSYWGPEFAARLIIESPTAKVDEHPEVQEVARLFVETAAAVDRLLHDLPDMAAESA